MFRLSKSVFLKKLILILVFSTIFYACRSVEQGSLLSEVDTDILSSTDATLEEISGACVKDVKPDGSYKVLLVGDRSFVVSELSIDSNDLVTEKTIDIKTIVDSDDKRSTSQWEAIACDRQGQVHILDEDPGTIYVLDPDLTQLKQVIDLKYKRNDPEGWRDEPNSRGEGMLLLKNGHILVLKEKLPSLIVEFGPKEQLPEGMSKDLLVSNTSDFPIAATKKINFYPLKIWEFNDDALSIMKDFSEITVGPNHKVYVLSQESKKFARIEATLRVDENRVALRTVFDLPNSIKKPEALAIAPNFLPIVVSDEASIKKNNINFLEPLPLEEQAE